MGGRLQNRRLPRTPGLRILVTFGQFGGALRDPRGPPGDVRGPERQFYGKVATPWHESCTFMEFKKPGLSGK